MAISTANDEVFRQLFCLIGEIHHVALKKPANKANFRGQGRLIHLLAHNQDVSQRELANLAQVKPGSISEVLERLEKAKLVKRWRDDSDRRIVRVRLTDKGEQLWQENRATRHQFEKKMLQTVTDNERETFIRVIQKMQRQLETDYGDYLPQKGKECKHV